MKNRITEKMDERLILDKISDDTYYIVGAEIRARRYRLAMTLDALADGICSLSYLCKIENSRIVPNRMILEELCERIQLTRGQVDILLNLREALEKCVKDFFEGSSDAINYFFKKGKSFDNYRYSIIQLIYYIYHKELSKANKVYLELLQISQTMREFDFIIFSIFSAYLHYYNFRFNEAIEILEKIDSFNLDETVDALKHMCLLKSSFGANRPETYLHYLNVKRILIDRGEYELLDEVRYIICLYHIKNESFYYIAKEIDSLKKKEYRESLKLMKCFKEKNVSMIMNYDDKALTKYAKMLKLYVTDFDAFKRSVSEYDNLYYVYDFDYNYLTILANRFDERYPQIIFNEIIPMICNTDDNYIRHVILKEVACLNTSTKSRNLLRAYYLLFGPENDYANFDGDNE